MYKTSHCNLRGLLQLELVGYVKCLLPLINTDGRWSSFLSQSNDLQFVRKRCGTGDPLNSNIFLRENYYYSLVIFTVVIQYRLHNLTENKS